MRRLLILYSHFAPAFKAGGPVQSLVNLVKVLNGHYRIHIVCQAYDLGDRQSLSNVTLNQWNFYDENVSVFYTTGRGYRAIQLALRKCRPDIVYINGMFLPAFNWYGIWMAKRSGCKVVVAPRGMLQQGALDIRPLKKKIFLFLARQLGLYRKIYWHATDIQEKNDIERMLRRPASVHVVVNVPKPPVEHPPIKEKVPGSLRLVYLSVITEKKNLHLVLEALHQISTPIRFDIYGPIKEPGYWRRCEKLMSGHCHEITYRGTIQPEEVLVRLAQYHALILPTRGENFGHVIYEALNVGTLPMVSLFTPWGNLQDKGAGVVVDLTVSSIKAKIELLIKCDGIQYSKASLRAYRIAKDFFEQHNYMRLYQNMFDGHN